MARPNFLVRLTRFIVGHPLPILAVLGALTAVAAFTAPRIQFDFSPQSVNAGDTDAIEFAEQFKQTFGYEDALLFVVMEATGDRDVLDKEALQWQATIAEELLQLDQIAAVQTVATLQLPQFSFSSQNEVATVPAIDRFPVDTATENRLRGLVESSGMLKGTLLSADYTVAGILVVIDPGERDVKSMRAVVNSVRQALQDMPPPESYRLELAGLPVLRVDIVENLQADQALILPLAAVFFLAALGVVFRRPSGTIIPLLAVGAGLAWTIAILVAAGQSLNIMSNILPVLLLIIGVSNSVHIICRFAEEAGKPGRDLRTATVETMTRMWFACLLTFATTAIGFGSLVAARNDLLRSFGWQTSLGLGLLYISVMLVPGTLLPFFRPPRSGHSSGGEPSGLERVAAAVGYAVARHSKTALAAGLLIVAGAFWVSRGLVVNSSMIETYEDDHPTIRAMRVVEAKLAGILPIEVSLQVDDPQTFLSPEIYRKVREFTDDALQQPGVLFARSYADIHQDVYANFRNDPKLFDELPGLDEKGASRIRRTDSLIRRAGDSIHYETFVSRDGKQARILLRVRDIGSLKMLVVIDHLNEKLQDTFGTEPAIRYRLTGDAYLNARAMDGFVRDLFSSLLLATVTIFSIIGLLFRSVRYGLISVIPNLAPLAVTLGYIGLRGYDLNAGNVIVFAISLGIAVDNTIHLLSRYREEAAQGGDVAQAIKRSYVGTGRAIVLTTGLIVAGLLILFFSDFLPTRRFAELMSVTMIAALFGNLFLLPACIVLFRKRDTTAKPVGAPEQTEIGGTVAERAPQETMQGRPEAG
jgi:predicted RND superfamily exporter protein